MLRLINMFLRPLEILMGIGMIICFALSFLIGGLVFLELMVSWL